MTANSKKADSLRRLLRSRADIARVLEALVARRETVTAELAGDRSHFTSHIIRADPSGQFIVIAMAADKSANAALLSVPRVTLVSTPGDWHVEFVADEPREVMHQSTPAIRLRYPEVVTARQRRQDARVDVPPMIPLRCMADAGGVMPFDAQIVDISLGGIGVLLYSSDIALEPGTVLLGSRIAVPGRDPVVTDLEVRYSEVVTLPDGSRAHRSGFHFVNASNEVKELVEELDKH